MKVNFVKFFTYLSLDFDKHIVQKKDYGVLVCDFLLSSIKDFIFDKFVSFYWCQWNDHFEFPDSI